MTQLHTSAPALRADAPERRRGFTVWLMLLRVLAVLHALAAIGQPLWIGQYLNGLYTWLGIHSAGAVAVVLFSFGLSLIGIGYAISGGRVWVPVVCWLLLFVEQVQSGMGYAGLLAVHVPLGVLVVTAAVLLAVWSLTRGAAKTRPRRKEQR
jgi:hypothetical protein